jgi:gas vesicle protein
MSNDSVKTLLAFVGGAIAGAAIGVLLAPDKGSETRKKIISKGKDLGNDLSDAALEKYDEFLKWKDSLLSDAEDTVNKAKNAVSEHVSKAESQVKNTVNNTIEKAESKLKSSQI